MTSSLTLQQIALLRRIGDGLGLPAYVLRPRNCVQDVELLCKVELVVSDSGKLSITEWGGEYLRELDLTGMQLSASNLGVVFGRAQAIGVEHWPQEY